MGRSFFRVVLFLMLLSVCAQAQTELSIEEAIRDLPERTNTVAGLAITSPVSTSDGLVAELRGADVPVTLRILGWTEYERLSSALELLLGTVVQSAELTGEVWRVEIESVEVSTGFNGPFVVDLSINRWLVRLNETTVLDFTRRLDGEPQAVIDPEQQQIEFSLAFREIPELAQRDQTFAGWRSISADLAAWAQGGIDASDQEIMGTVLELKVLTQEDVTAARSDLLEQERPSGFFLGGTLDLLLPQLFRVNADEGGLLLGPIMTEAQLILERREVGSDLRFRALRMSYGLGVFADFGLHNRAVQQLVLTQWLSTGPMASVAITGYFPSISDERVQGTAYGIGLELQGGINIVSIVSRYRDIVSPLTDSDYYYFFSLLSILQLRPEKALRVELLLGLSGRFLPDFNEQLRWIFYPVSLYQVGLNVGLRLKTDLLGERAGPIW